MLWKQRYDTTIHEGVFPSAPLVGRSLTGALFAGAQVVLGGYDSQDFSDQEILAKLFERDFPGVPWLARGLFGGPEVGEELEVLTPPSRHSATWVWDLTEQVAAFEPRRVFCWSLPLGLLMLGPATEDAWEYFERRIQGESRP